MLGAALGASALALGLRGAGPAAAATGSAARAASAPGGTRRVASCPPAPSAVVQGDLVAAAARHGLTIRPRSAWGASLPKVGEVVPETPRFLLVHHTAGTNDYAEQGVARQIQGIFRFHTGKEKGWPDVAYNFFVDRFGGVWEGRTGSLSGPVRGDATGGNQGSSVLCCLIGDFTSVAPPAAAQASLVKLLASLADRYGIATAPGSTATFVSRKSNRWPLGACIETPTISGHRQMSYTSCPGDALFTLVQQHLPSAVTRLRG